MPAKGLFLSSSGNEVMTVDGLFAVALCVKPDFQLSRSLSIGVDHVTYVSKDISVHRLDQTTEKSRGRKQQRLIMDWKYEDQRE